MKYNGLIYQKHEYSNFFFDEDKRWTTDKNFFWIIFGRRINLVNEFLFSSILDFWNGGLVLKFT
jgi:hypothetical protein